MDLLKELWAKYKTTESFDAAYWEGVVIGAIMERALERAKEEHGKINSKTINEAMESFSNEDFGGLVPNVTFTKTNHEASFKARIVKVHEDGNFIPLTNFFTPEKEKIEFITH
jgi:hypothetical protein